MTCLMTALFAQVPELLYYKFNTPGTSVQNYAQAATAVGSNPATISGTGLSVGSTGLTGTALVGTGTSSSTDVINTGWLTNLSGSFTIAFWTSNITPSSTLWYIFGDAGATSLRCFTNGVAGANNWQIRGGGLPDLTFTGGATAAPNMLHAVYDASTSQFRGYINGVLVSTVTVSGTIAMAGTGFQVGGYSSNSNLSGLMDEFRIYNRALTQLEITATYNVEIGAFSAPNDAGVTQINSPVAPVSPGLQNVTATIKNYGSNVISSVNVNWSVNGVLQTPVPFIGTLDTTGGIGSNTSLITLGSFTFPAGNNTIKAWTSLPNNQPDTVNLNDTAQVTIYFATTLSGTYTIGGTTPDFTSFGNALTALYSGGVSGPVTFNVAPGTYTEQLTLNSNPPGVSATNTVTFKSATGDSSSVILQYTASGTADNWVILLEGADYFTFKQMTIRSLNTTYGRIFELRNGADYNTVQNNRLICDGASSSTTGAVYQYTGLCNYNTYKNNFISGGYYTVYVRGSSSTVWEVGNVIQGNEIVACYYYPIYSYYQDGVQIVDNYIHDVAPAYCYGIYCYYPNNAYRITGNRVHIIGTSSTALYGIRDYYGNYYSYNASPTGYGLVANNMITLEGGTGTNYGLYAYNSNGTEYYYNSILVTGTGTSGRALHQYNTASNTLGQTFKNNVFVNTGGGYAAYYSTVAQVTATDYNNYYTTGVNLAYWGGNMANLAALQTASSKDTYSISISPDFVSNGDLHSTSVAMWQTGTPVTAVQVDIDGEPRHALTP